MADPVQRAHDALATASAKVRDAEHARAEAHDALEVALAERGWKRLRGAFSPGATPLFVNVLYPGATLEVRQVLEVLGQAAA